MIYFNVDDSLCTRCGLCASDCPSSIIGQTEEGRPSVSRRDAMNCIGCQHCLAICPSGAISILKKKPVDSIALDTARMPTLPAMDLLVRARRSVRQYRDENIPRDLLDRLLAAIAHAPSGVNRHDLVFHVIDDRSVMRDLRDTTLAKLETAVSEGRIPETFSYLHDAVPAFRKGHDIIFRGAPHALIVSAGPHSVCPVEDAVIALAQFEMLACSAGLGTVWWGMFRMLLAVLPEIKETLGIPADHEYCYAMLFGFPAVRYSRTTQHDNRERIRRIGDQAAG